MGMPPLYPRPTPARAPLLAPLLPGRRVAARPRRRPQRRAGEGQVRLRPGLLELGLHLRRLLGLALPLQRLREPEEAPAVARVEPQVLAVHGLGLGEAARIQ